MTKHHRWSFIPALSATLLCLSSNTGGIMNVELITREDLLQFKAELVQELKQVLHQPAQQAKQWMKSADVRKLLNISPGTLQNLRINGTLRFTKIGGIFYYKAQDITKILEGNGTV
jgi:hypothetical protein